MDGKTSKNAKIMKGALSLSRSMKIVIIIDYDNNSSTVVYGVKSLGFHSFEALNDNLEGLFFSQLNFDIP